MAHWTCSADYCRAFAENGALAHDVTWPVRLRRWWEGRRGQRWFPGRDAEPSPAVGDLWNRVERAFRLLDVAEMRPDPALTRRIACALLDEVRARLPTVDDPAERAALERAVDVVRHELVPAG